MVNIVMDERAYAERALKDLTLGPKPVETLGRIARYYYSEGYKKREISSLLEDFMIKCDPKTNVIRWQPIIDRQANLSDKYDLVDIAGVEITIGEIDTIKQIKGKLLQKLMFTMLCLAKYGNAISTHNNGWVNRRDNEIFSLANITATNKRQSLMINDLWTMGYIGYSRAVDNINVNVKIIDEKGSAAMLINDFRNLGNQYLRYCGEQYIECQCCGAVIKKRSNSHKYCKSCAPEINIKKTIENQRGSLRPRDLTIQ